MIMMASYTWDRHGACLAINDSVMTPSIRTDYLENPIIGASILYSRFKGIQIFKMVS